MLGLLLWANLKTHPATSPLPRILFQKCPILQTLRSSLWNAQTDMLLESTEALIRVKYPYT